MSLWKIGAEDVSEETQHFKDKLASKDGEIAGQKAKLMKQAVELEELRTNLTEALQKLAAESERALDFQSKLTQCSDDLREAKNTSRNLEASLQTANGKLKAKDREMSDMETALERLSGTSNGYHSRSRELEQEKSILETRIRELESNVRHLQSANAAASRRPTSRSSSSAFNDLKIRGLERDLEELREQLDEKKLEIEGLQGKLTQAQDDLLRVDNESMARETKHKARIDELQSLIQEKDEELEYFREGGDGGREEELLKRIEEDDAKIAALEAMIRQSDDVKTFKEKLRSAEKRVRVESEKVAELKTRNTQLEQEREAALNELEDNRTQIHELEELLQERQDQLDRLEEERSRPEITSKSRDPATSDNVEAPLRTTSGEQVDVLHVAKLLNAIGRLREERDNLRRNLEFLETEHRFTVEALEKRLISNSPNQNSNGSQPISNTVPALAILLSHSQTQLEQRQLLAVRREHQFDHYTQVHSEKYAALEEEADQIACQLKESEERREDLESRLEMITGEYDDLVTQLEDQKEDMRSSRRIMQDRLEEVEVNLKEVSRTLEIVESERDSLALQVTNLTADLEAAQEELAEAESRYSALQSQQLSSMSSSEATRALREQIEQLEGRVGRRTEQIGIHQHDIRRLETNLKLQEDRLGEMNTEIETLVAEKEAMLEDCADAREARDEALSRMELLEEDLELLESKLAESDQALNAIISLLVQTKANARTSAEQFQSHIADLEDQLRHHDANAALDGDFSEKLSSAAEELRQVTVAFSLSQLQLQKANTLARVLIAKKAALERDLIDANEQIAQVRTANRRLEEKCSTLRRKSAPSAAELATRSSEYQAEIDKLNVTISEITAEREKLQKQYAHAITELEERQQEKEDILTEYEEARARASGLHEEEMEGLQKQLTATIAELEEERLNRASSEQELQETLQARTQLHELEKQTDILHQEIARLSKSQQDLEVEKEMIQNEAESLRAELDRVLQERANLEEVYGGTKDTNQALSEEISRLREERERLVQDHISHADEHQRKLESLNLHLEAQVVELTRSVEDKAKEIGQLERELDTVIQSSREKEHKSAVEMQALSAENEQARTRLSEIEEEIQGLHKEFERNEALLNESEDERGRLQELITSLEAQVQKSRSYTNALERQVKDGETAMEVLKTKLSDTQAELSRAETTAKTSEVNLSLQSAQFKRELAELQDKLAAFSSRRNLEDALAELEERNNEMEELLRAKCAEIEENDDRALEMLKDNKKLSGKVEALTRKVQNLQTKLAAAKAAVASSKAAVEAVPTNAKPLLELPPQLPPQNTETQPQASRRRSSRSSIGANVPASAEKPITSSVKRASTSRNVSRPPPTTARPKTPERAAPVPVFKLRTPEQPRSQERISEPPSSVVGVKRRAPDDFEPSEIVPPQGFTIDSLPSRERENESTTPRVRRIFGNLQSGFTPVRNKVLSSPKRSPKRQTTVLSTPLIQDVTNSPRSSVPLDSAAKQKRSWLGKIRGTSSQATVKPASRQVFTYIGETRRP